MESYNSYNTYDHYSYNSYTNPCTQTTQYEFQGENITERPHQPFRSSTFPARSKNLMKKQPIAPLPPTPPKVYKVDPVDFRDVVQKLTGRSAYEATTSYQLTRLQEVAPPPLSLSPPGTVISYLAQTLMEEDKPRISLESMFGGLSPLGYSLSPASMAWCSSILMSPGTVSPMDQPSTLLY